ncbi:MAG: alpha/beta hydrolase [Minisyncoccota bacterium]
MDKIDKNTSDLAFVMHGLGGFKEQSHIQAIVNSFKKKGYTVVSFDTTNTFGESEGNYSNATVTNYYEDLEDVINWATNELSYEGQFILAGHSIGGLSVSLFAEKYPEKVKALALVSTIVSGELWKQAQNKEMLKNWENSGVWIRESNDPNLGNRKVLKWTFAKDIMQYDLLKDISKLTMPVLLIVGDNDPTATVSHQEVFFGKLPGKKELHVIKNAGHVFRDELHLKEIGNIISEWLRKI